ncbi:hypothetical protein RI367_007199 [Sorochytrium milnesiophthora]
MRPVVLERVPTAAGSAQYTFSNNGDDSSLPSNGVEWLKSLPRGAYTGSRTFGLTSIVNFSLHVSRTASSLQQMRFGEPEEPQSTTRALAPYRDVQALRGMMTEAAGAALAKYYQLNKIDTAEAAQAPEHSETKVTWLVCWDAQRQQQPVRILVHCAPLVSPNKSAVRKAKVAGYPRGNPQAKDTAWVHDREQLEQLLQDGTSDVLLTDGATHNIYEGLSSNFFAVKRRPGAPGTTPTDFLLCTAPLDSVLTGTILNMVIDIARRHDISVEFAFPSDRQLGTQYKACFITSTSRLVRPIDLVEFVDGRHVLIAYCIMSECG